MKRVPLKLVTVPSLALRKSEPEKFTPSSTEELKSAPRKFSSNRVGNTAKLLPEGREPLMPLSRALLKSALPKLTL